MKHEVVKKSVNISGELVEKVESAIGLYPGLNFTLVVNQALEQWLSGPQKIDLAPTFKDRMSNDNSKGFGPLAKKKK